MSEEEANTVRRSGPIRITLAASVANNLDALQKSIALLCGHVGCETCFSGHACQFTAERDLVIGPRGTVEARANTQRTFTAQDAADTVFVKVAPEAANNIDAVKALVSQVAGLVGCRACHSGFDIYYAQELGVLSAGARGNVTAV
jgi:hypothetical protein